MSPMELSSWVSWFDTEVSPVSPVDTRPPSAAVAEAFASVAAALVLPLSFQPDMTEPCSNWAMSKSTNPAVRLEPAPDLMRNRISTRTVSAGAIPVV